MRQFWLRHHWDLLDALKGDNGLATAVWSDLDHPDVSRRYAIYFDSIFVADALPYYGNPEARGLQQTDYAAQYFIWTVIVEALAPLACSDGDDCPIVFVPQLFSVDSDVEPADTSGRVPELKERAHALTYHYMSEVLGLDASDLSPHTLMTTALRIGEKP
ncbi:MAG TPA: hypothetical protein VI485_13080 [Vicinamibacterales bacterium]|nr:hypothetical protein [Vicinamibacterales bacterium]